MYEENDNKFNSEEETLGFYEVIFAHSDCDAVCNLLFAIIDVVHAMSMSVDCTDWVLHK